MPNLVILGAGTGGTLMANKLARRLEGWTITLVDRDAMHVYQPGLLFVPFGGYRPEEIVQARQRFVPPGVTLDLAGAVAIEPDRKQVVLGDQRRLDYDLLIVATGCRIVPEETPGLTDSGWQQRAFDFYTLEGASGLANALDGFTGGRLVVHIAEMPIKCPVAPLEFTFLADAWLRERGLRDKTELVYATPLDGAFTKPRAAEALGALLDKKHVLVEADFAVAEVDDGALVGHDGRRIDYDLLVTVPVHMGSKAIAASGIGDGMGFLPTDRHTLQSRDFPDIFALGDSTDLPTSKAGSVAHFQGEVLVENVLRHIAGKALLPEFDGHANCFVETGDGKAILIDFNYEVEPLPGRFPLPGIGPFTLLGESHINHWGKLAFKWMYWELLLKGKELPISHRMSMAGKWR